MEFKVVISDPETGKSYNKEIKGDNATKLNGKKIGEEFDGKLLSMEGYILKITGGSDKSGFPMKKGVHKPVDRILMSGGVGYRPKRKVRKRKRVRGEIITEDIVQINTKVIKKGKQPLDKIFGISKEEDKEKKEVKSEEKEKVKEEKTEKKESKD